MTLEVKGFLMVMTGTILWIIQKSLLKNQKDNYELIKLYISKNLNKMKKLLNLLIILTSFTINFYSQNKENCTDSIILLMIEEKNKISYVEDILKCNPYNFLLKCDSLAGIDKRFIRYAPKISSTYYGLVGKINRNDTSIRKKLIDSHLILLETGPYRANKIFENLIYWFKKDEFSKDDIERIINIYPKIKGRAIPFYYRLIGKLDIKNMISVLKNEQEKKYDKETKRILTATLIRLGDKETIKRFLKSIDNRLLGENKYHKKDLYEDLLMVHYMSNRKVYDKLFDLLESNAEIFIEHWSDEYGEGDTYWSLDILVANILFDNIKKFPDIKYSFEQKTLTDKQKKIINKWHRKNKNFIFEKEYNPNSIFRK